MPLDPTTAFASFNFSCSFGLATVPGTYDASSGFVDCYTPNVNLTFAPWVPPLPPVYPYGTFNITCPPDDENATSGNNTLPCTCIDLWISPQPFNCSNTTEASN